MVRSGKSQHHADEDDDREFASVTPDVSSHKEGKRGDQKVNSLRSKHSETEQRRRCKINERFQVLKGLIPENDQKRDKASFLLDVIQYIQFLQEKLQMYEGTYQGWNPDPSKLSPWRTNPGSLDSFIMQSQLVKNGSEHQDASEFSHAQSSFESALDGSAFYKASDDSQPATNQAIPLNMQLQPDLSAHSRGSFCHSEHLASQSQLQFWQGRPSVTECLTPAYTPIEVEELKMGSEDSMSSSCSQGLLNNLTRALQSSGVDLSQANISVQLDISKRAHGGSTSTVSSSKEHQNEPDSPAIPHYPYPSSEENLPNKRLRTEQC